MEKTLFSQIFHNMIKIGNMMNCEENFLQVQIKFKFTR